MFDISTVNKRYFQIKLDDITLNVEPPKVKTLKKIASLSRAKGEEAMGELSEAVRTLLNKNTSGYVVPDEIIDELDYDQLNEIIERYFDWLSNEKNGKN